MDDNSYAYKCKLCDFVCNSKKLLEQHIINHNK